MSEISHLHRSGRAPDTAPAKDVGQDRSATTGKRVAGLNDTAAQLNEAAPVAQLSRMSASLGLGVVQRVVLSKFVEGKMRYYSSLGSGKTDYATREEAQEEDDRLSKDDQVIHSKLYRSKKDKSGNLVPRRSATPYSYDQKTSVSAKPKVTRQGPHFLGFSSTEHRLEKRLEDTEDPEIKDKALEDIKDQVLHPTEFEKLIDVEKPSGWSSSKHKERMVNDYRSRHASYEEISKNGPFGVGSHFHLQTRELMQMHPYTTYGVDVKSSGHGERRNSRLGKNSIDGGASFKSQPNAEDYLATRGKLYHESDTESEHEDFQPFDFKHRTDDRPEPRYTRPKRQKRKNMDAKRKKEETPIVPELDPVPEEDERDDLATVTPIVSSDDEGKSPPPKRRKGTSGDEDD